MWITQGCYCIELVLLNIGEFMMAKIFSYVLKQVAKRNTPPHPTPPHPPNIDAWVASCHLSGLSFVCFDLLRTLILEASKLKKSVEAKTRPLTTSLLPTQALLRVATSDSRDIVARKVLPQAMRKASLAITQWDKLVLT